MEKNENKVEVEDVDADNIKEMLVFIYSGKVLALNLWNSAGKIDNKQRPKCPGPGGGEVTRHLYPRGGGGVARHQDCSVLGVFHPDRGRGDNLGHCQGWEYQDSSKDQNKQQAVAKSGTKKKKEQF